MPVTIKTGKVRYNDNGEYVEIDAVGGSGTTVDPALSTLSENPVHNKAMHSATLISAEGVPLLNQCYKFVLQRYGITDSNADERINGLDSSQLTELIDYLNAQGGWMIWMLHTSGAYWSDTMRDNIASAIDHALNNGVQIVTAEYGFKTYFGA